MKKLILCLMVALTVFSVSSFAQQGGGGGMQMRMKQTLIDSLQFTSVQADSVMAVRQDFRPQMMELRNLSGDERTAKMNEISAQMNVRYKNFLSADQIAKLNAFQQRQREQMRNRGGGGGGNNR